MVSIPADKVVETAVDATKAATVFEHIVQRRIEYLIATLIAHQMGLLDTLLNYGAGVCV